MQKLPPPLALFDGAEAWYVPETGSTQDEVFRLAQEGAPEGTLVSAGFQHAGKGRLGRAWLGNPGDNLTFSFLTLRSFSYPPSLLWGLAAAQLLEALGMTPHIKWPNDVLVGGKKICGILVQSRGGKMVTGIGLNVRQTEFPPDLRKPATSLLLEGYSSEPGEVLRLFVPLLRQVLSLRTPAPEVEERLWGLGTVQTVQLPSGEGVEGVFEGLGPEGEALLRTANGMRKIHSAEWL